MEKDSLVVDMPRRRQSRRSLTKSRRSKRNKRTTKRRRRQSGGYGYIKNPQQELISRLVGDEGMGVPTMEEVPTA